jgi:hypothetical protein
MSIKTSSNYEWMNARRSPLEWHLETRENAKTLKYHSFLSGFDRTPGEPNRSPGVMHRPRL